MRIFFAFAWVCLASAEIYAQSQTDVREVVAKYCGYDVLQNYDYSPLTQQQAAEVCIEYVAGEPELLPFIASAICVTDETYRAKEAGKDTSNTVFIQTVTEDCEAKAGGKNAVEASMEHWKNVRAETPWANWPRSKPQSKLLQAQMAGVKGSLTSRSSREDWSKADELDQHASASRIIWRYQGQPSLSVEQFKELAVLTDLVVQCVDTSMAAPDDALNRGRSLSDILQTCYMIKSLEVSGESSMEFKNLPQ